MMASKLVRIFRNILGVEVFCRSSPPVNRTFYVQGQQVTVVRKAAKSAIRQGYMNQQVKHTAKSCFGVNSPKYIAVIDSKIKTQLKEHFPNRDGVLQQDRAQCRTSKVVQRQFEANNFRVMEGSGKSP